MKTKGVQGVRMAKSYTGVKQSLELYEKAGKLIPGWTQLISRRSDQFAHGVSPIYAQHAKGSRFTDVDGNEYLDWVNAVGAIILGHADDVVDDAVIEQIRKGSIYTVNSPLELELAEELNATIPSSEMVRYTKAGGEACSVAVRIARGTTGRDTILFSGYHGWTDWYQAANFGVDPESGEYPFAGIEPIGIPKVLEASAIPFSYGDINALEFLLKEHSGTVAAIMMEPMRSELPPEGYLESVKALAKAHDVILIFDEVSCGFRTAIGGVQEYLGVTPDMTVISKSMSNGYPMGAVVGSREVMEPAKRMFVSSQYWSDITGIVAALTTIRELKKRDAQTRFKDIGDKLKTRLNKAIAEVGISGKCTGVYANPVLSLDIPEGIDPRKVSTVFIHELAKQGIHCQMSFKATLAHSDEDIEETGIAATKALSIIKEGLGNKNLDALLEADLKKEPFRRLVR